MQRRTLLAAGALTPLAARAQNAAPEAAAILRERLRHEGVGLVSAVIDGPTVRFAAAGRRDAAREAAPDEDTLFEIGSVTKTFTALLLADAAVRGELKLDDAVQAVLPDGLRLRDSAGVPISWADLATHRSGLPRLPPNLRDPSGADPYDYSRKDLLAMLAAWKPERARDTQWEYSNLGYGLLGEALAMRARTSYAALLLERVLEPLGLADMRLALRDTAVPGLMPGHDAARRSVPNWRFDAIAGAGALIGSARSLARYAHAAIGGFEHPLKAAFKLALTPRAGGPSANNAMALAWISAPLNGRRVFNHDGATAGYASSVFLDPERQRAALVLSNAQIGVNDLALHLLDPTIPPRDLAAEKRLAERPVVKVATEALAELAGSYVLNPQFKVTIRARAGQLFAQATGQGEFELFALDARRFFARVTPLEMHFEGEGGAAPAFVLHQGGQKLRFVRE
jgi:D-alanyl-D-alanine-carboxypeptidase/D-alanyl-D-alanine-endopeptidase